MKQTLLSGVNDSEHTQSIYYVATAVRELAKRVNVDLLWSGGFRLVCLQFLPPLHLHGAVHNPVRSQRLQAHHLHDNHLEGTHKQHVVKPQVYSIRFTM